MKTLCLRTVFGSVLLATVVAVSGVATALSPSASVTTAIQGWERHFRLDWTAQGPPSGRAIDGYIYNNYGSHASNVQILAQALDGSGSLVGQQLAWVPGGVPPLSRSYFKVPALPAAASYRVSVWAYDWLQGDFRDP
jgi:hypothetical protein